MPKKTVPLVIIFIFIFFIAPPNVYAYLDPGSGSYLIQIIVASLAGFGYLLKINWVKIKSFFSKRNKQELENKN